MSLTAFLSSLFEHGRVAVAHPQEHVASAELERTGPLLAERASALALEFPGEPPPLDLPVARWAALQLFRACQLAVYRELDAAAIDELLAVACPDGEPASRHWSADLTFIFLPDLIRHATTAAAADPLVERLRLWAAKWPLSSVGVSQIEPIGVAEIAAHRGLLQFYLDRILARKDWPRLADPAVRAAAGESLGAFAAEWPAAAKYLKTS